MELMIVIAVSEVISLILAIRILRSEGGVVLKVASCVIVSIPIIGPVIYFFGLEPPPVKPLKRQQRNANIGSYQRDAEYEIDRMKSNIKRKQRHESNNGE